jgi:hypothetical protein
MSTPPNPQQQVQAAGPRSLRQKIAAGAGLAGAAAVYIAYLILTGGTWGHKSYVDQDLRDQGDRFARADEVQSDFTRANVSGLDMFRMQAHEVVFVDTIARNADLTQADFRRGNLQGADFSYSYLVDANFTGADLRGATFVGADIRGAIFDSAILDGADLRDTLPGPFCNERAPRLPREEVARTFPQRNERPILPLHCVPDANECCYNSWMGTRVEGTRVCRTPFTEIFSTTHNERTNVIGQYLPSEVNTREGGETYCAHDLLR